MTLDRLNRQIARSLHLDLAPGDEVPLHAAQTAILRQDPDYFPRWVAYEVSQGRPPATEDMVEAAQFLDTRLRTR